MRLQFWSPIAFAKRLVNRAFTASHPPPPTMASSSITSIHGGFFGLPTELLHGVLDFLRPADLLKFALAAYPQLEGGLMPPLTIRTFQRITCRMPNIPVPNWPLPMELTDQILGYLHDPGDVITFCFTHQAVLFQYIGDDALDPETIAGLRSVVRDNVAWSI